MYSATSSSAGSIDAACVAAANVYGSVRVWTYRKIARRGTCGANVGRYMLIPATSSPYTKDSRHRKLCRVTFDESGATKMGQVAFGPIRRFNAAACSAYDSFVSAFRIISAADLSTSINCVLLLCFNSDILAISFCLESVNFAILRSLYSDVFVNLPLFRQRETCEF